MGQAGAPGPQAGAAPGDLRRARPYDRRVTDEHRAARAWVAAYAERVGVPAPTDEEFEAILELAAVAAHASERVAAPVACWLAGRAGIDLVAALAAATTDEG